MRMRPTVGRRSRTGGESLAQAVRMLAYLEASIGWVELLKRTVKETIAAC